MSLMNMNEFPMPEKNHNQWVALKSRLSFEMLGLIAVLAFLYIVFTFTAPNFLTMGNQLNILQSAAFVGIIAFGMTLVIICGEIDISVGSAVALSSALLGVLVDKLGLPIGFAVLLVLIEGTLIGLLGGYIRARFGVPSFIVTLAWFSGLKGLALFMTNAFPIYIDSPSFEFWGAGRIWGIIPVPAVFLVAAFAIFYFISKRTPFGRSVFAVGGNAEAARLSGLPVARIRMLVLGTTGLLAAIVGILLSSRLSSGNPNIGSGLEFEVIAAVIIGGTSLAGGKGSMVGTLVGVLLITVLKNGMTLWGINPYTQNIVNGAIVLIAVLISSLRNKRETA